MPALATSVAIGLMTLAVSPAPPAPLPAADVLAAVHERATRFTSWHFRHVSVLEGVEFHNVVGAVSPGTYYHSSSKHTPAYASRDDPFAQAIIVKESGYVVFYPGQRALRRYEAGGERRLPGTSGGELVLHVAPSWPVGNYDTPRTDAGLPVVVSEIAVTDLAVPTAGVERVADRWCHVLYLRGGEKIYIDLGRDATVVARDYVYGSTGKPTRRLTVVSQRQTPCGTWVPAELRVEALAGATAEEQAKRPLIVQVVEASINAREAWESPVSLDDPAVIELGTHGYRQLVGGGTTHTDRTAAILAENNTGARGSEAERTPSVGGFVEGGAVQSSGHIVSAAVAAALSFGFGRSHARGSMTPDKSSAAPGPGSKGTRRGRAGLSLVEVLVVIGVTAVLLGLLLPTLSAVRGHARTMHCAGNLRQMSLAIHAYAGDNHGWIPRDSFPHRDLYRPYQPYWGYLILPYVGGYARPEPHAEPSEVDFSLAGVYLCPSHPQGRIIPSCYVINAFSFETRPDWKPSGPTRLASTVNPSGVILFAEIADWIEAPESEIGLPRIHHLDRQDVWSPGQLPDGHDARATEERHGGGANVSFFDGRAVWRPMPKMRLGEFDDGLVVRNPVLWGS